MNEWDGSANFSAYTEVEALANYRSGRALDAYRDERLQKYEPYVRFFRALGVPPDGLRVVDIGAGSSAFLYQLERSGVLLAGTALELSVSRHEFAERWRHDAGFYRVTNICSNFADVRLSPGGFDRVSVLDDTYLYLRPESEDYPSLLLGAAHEALTPGGSLVLDFRNDLPLARAMAPEGRTFETDLPASNAFSRAVYRQWSSRDGRWLRNESTYFSEDRERRHKVEVTEVCDVDALAVSLPAYGYSDVSLYGDLAMTAFDAEKSARAIVVAKK